MNRKIIPSLMLSGCLAMTACLAIPAFPAQASQEIYHISEDDSPVEYHSPEEIRDFFHSRPFSRTQPDTFDEEPDLESETAVRRYAGYVTEMILKFLLRMPK